MTEPIHVSIELGDGMPSSKDEEEEEVMAPILSIRRFSTSNTIKERVNRVLRVVSSGLRRKDDLRRKDSKVETQCCICWGGAGTVVMKDCPTAKSGTLKHGMCLICVKTYLTLQIKEKRVSNIRCPVRSRFSFHFFSNIKHTHTSTYKDARIGRLYCYSGS